MAKMTPINRVVSKNVFASIAAEMERRVGAATALVHREMVKKVSTPGPPRSTPGNPPHVGFKMRKGKPTGGGALRQSIQPTVVRTGNTIVGDVTANVEHAGYLEFGTSRMAARPFIRPTMAEQRENVRAIMRGKK
jgi:HK97 gp10 family phage protein